MVGLKTIDGKSRSSRAALRGRAISAETYSFDRIALRVSRGVFAHRRVGCGGIQVGHLFPELPGLPAQRVADCVVVSETMNSGLRRQVGQQFRQFHRKGCEVAVAEPANV